ncbi:YdcF family protein [Dyella subtropica]|uniref:YdcF family protein n=1 Tax=Dyella subtropica TaxID=2992127 RepID=UPI003CE4B4C3
MLVFVLLGLLGFALGRLKRRGLGRVCYALALLFFWGVGCGAVPSWMSRDLQGDYASAAPANWPARSAIVLLGAGTFRDEAHGRLEPSYFANGRILTAVMLYRECRAAGGDCKVLVSGGDAQDHGAPEAEVYRDALLRADIPATDLIVESRSLSTWQNAQFSKPLLEADAAQRVLLVTSGTHLRRSLLYFAHFGLHPVPVRGDYVTPMWSFYPVAWNFTVADAALHEYVGIARYHVYNAIGWNAPKASAAAGQP